jgi:outer membrane protein
MKKLSVALFVVLFLAVAALFILQFSGNKKDKESSKSGIENQTAPVGIAYVNIDTVILKFDMFLDRRGEILDKQKNAEAELTKKGSQYEKGVKDFQEKVNKGLVTRATAAQMEQALVQQQQELVNLRDQLQGSLMEEEQVMNRQVLEYITRFLEENKSDYNYTYILGRSFGGNVLYANSSHDITQKVLDGINKKYQTEKK